MLFAVINYCNLHTVSVKDYFIMSNGKYDNIVILYLPCMVSYTGNQPEITARLSKVLISGGFRSIYTLPIAS